MLARLLGDERLEKLPRGSGLAVLAAGVLAAGLGPAAALALADGGTGGTGLGGVSTAVVSPTGTTGATGTTGINGYRTTTSTVVSGTTTSTIVNVTTPCSGSLGTTTTTTGPATTTTVPSTATIPVTATLPTTAWVPTTETVPTTMTVNTTTTVEATTPEGTPTTETVPTTAVVPTTMTVSTSAVIDTTRTVTTTEAVPTTTTATTPGITTVTTTPACPATTTPPTAIAVPKRNPFNGRAMWIWEMQATNRGSVASIIAQAKRYGIGAVYVKSSDGSTWWPQFSRELVTELHEAGLKVCAWQYVYGVHPAAEANLGFRAARDGADCLVIDAESDYQTRYPAAQTYISRLRGLIGKRYPVGLAGFPYVDYHLSFPYSVFLGPNGAQYNLPQMYWADIGTTVPLVYAHTYEYNEIYRRPIFPLGQLWNSGRGMSVSSIEQFNLFAKEYGAGGVSWWDWQSAPTKYFAAITKLPPQLVGYSVNKTPASVYRGNKGDPVIWAQEHLDGAGFHVAVDGDFGPKTQGAVRAFQRRHRLPASGVIDGPTWNALLKVTPVTVRWTRRRNRLVAVVARQARLAGGAERTTLIEPVPGWMKHTRSRNELHGEVGAGGSSGPGGEPGATGGHGPDATRGGGSSAKRGAG